MSENAYLMLAVAAKLRETNEIIDMLQQLIIDYKSGAELNPVLSTCLLLLHKQSLERTYQGDIIKMTEDLHKLEKAAFKPVER